MILEVQITDPKTGSSRKMRFSHSPVRIGRNQLNDLSLDTPFVSLPGIASGHCVDGPKASYLSVSINTPPAGSVWPATLPGDLVVDGRLLKSWGWHLIDVNIAMGNLIDFVSTLRKPGP